MKFRITVILMLLLAFLPAAAQDSAALDSANALYSKGDYEKAVQLYEKVLSSGAEAPELYYNLGNAYFKAGSLGRAILNYERAHRLDPSDEDINYNLDFASEKVTDKIDPSPQLMERWTSGFTGLLTETGWSVLCIVFFAAMIAMITLYIAGKSKPMRQLGFWSALVLLLLTVTSFTMARNRYKANIAAKEAIVTEGTITVKGSPSAEGTKLFIIHEGTKVKIEDTEDEWTEVKIANGNVGWVPSSSITAI